MPKSAEKSLAVCLLHHDPPDTQRLYAVQITIMLPFHPAPPPSATPLSQAINSNNSINLTIEAAKDHIHGDTLCIASPIVTDFEVKTMQDGSSPSSSLERCTQMTASTSSSSTTAFDRLHGAGERQDRSGHGGLQAWPERAIENIHLLARGSLNRRRKLKVAGHDGGDAGGCSRAPENAG